MSQKRILLIEDNPEDIELIFQAALHESKMPDNITVAQDEQKALDYLFNIDSDARRDINDLPEVILLDLRLPKMSGLEVLERIRSDERTKILPIIVLTSSMQEEDLIRSYALGANSYISKPVSSRDFTDTVRILGLYWFSLNVQPPHSRRI